MCETREEYIQILLYILCVFEVVIDNLIWFCRRDAGAKGGLPAVGLKLNVLVQRLQVRTTHSDFVSIAT